MKQIYVISLFFLPFWSFSQLYIKPYQSQESFLYVEGGLLYVEKNINIQKNPKGHFEASIYLRNEGQLLQGSEEHENSGNGMLSVFQEGKSSAYTYNYWGLPVRNTSSTSAFDIFNEPLDRTNSRPAIITSDYNGKANPLTISSRWLYKLSGQGYSDWKYIGNTFDIKPGEGFTMKGVDGTNHEVKLYGVVNNPGGEQRYDFRGLPNSGTIPLDISKDEILLVGNPYPSALDLKKFLEENTNTTGIAYFWDSKPVSSHYLQDYEGGYGAYSPGAGTDGYVPPVFQKYDNDGEIIGSTGNTGSYYTRRYSPIAQGFTVVGLNTGKVFFKNSYREFQKENPEFSEFKSSEKVSEKRDVPLIRLNVEFKDKYIRQLLIAFHPESTNGVDRAMDAKNFSPLETDAGIWNENEKYVIDIRPERSAIPLNITTTQLIEVGFHLAPGNDFAEDIYLWNSAENIYYNLKDQHVSIPFTSDDHPGKYWITFAQIKDGNDNSSIEQNEYFIFQNNSYQRAEIQSPASAVKIIGIYDSSGRKVNEIKGVANEFYYEIPTANLNRGIYIIKIISADGAIVSKKVIISN